MKKMFLIMAAIVLTEIVVLSAYQETIFNYIKADYDSCEELLMKPTISFYYFSADEKEIKYDEDYALNAAIIIYKQL